MKKVKKKINASILVIGNEILSGRTQELNVAFISSWLNKECGISVSEARIIPDIEKTIIFNVLDLSKKFNYVFTTGGIGPTHDDITAHSIAKALKVKYDFNAKAYKILENYYGKKKFNIGRKKMAKMPSRASLILNPSSAAPGFKVKNIFCLPGVPSILKSMINNCKKFLKKGLVTFSKNINGITVESNISLELERVQNIFLKKVDVGSYPFFKDGKVGVSIVCRSVSKKKLNLCVNMIHKIFRKKNIKILK
jgi:molybdenum cofactor synthesis domain-containing protein